MVLLEKTTRVKESLSNILIHEGFSLKSKKGLGRLGADIKALKDGKVWYIETVESEWPDPESFHEFYSAFFQAISRLNNKDCSHIIIAMPYKYREYLGIRAKIYKEAWKRLGKVFPELEIWLVDADNNKYYRTEWLSWLRKKK